MTGPIAFVFAMPMELKPLARRLKLKKRTVSGVEVRAGHLDDREVVAIVTGMGTALATAGTERLLGAVTPERVISVGITGAVEDDTPIGTLMLPATVVNSETGEEFTPHPYGGLRGHGVMWTTNRITPVGELPDLRARGVVALDMETAAIAKCCEALGVPWSVFRVISDRASDGSVAEDVFQMANQDGSPNWARVVRYVARHPHHVPRLAKLAEGSKLATELAVEAAITAVRAS